MIDYEDAELKELINASKKATLELSFLKQKKQVPAVKKLKIFRRSQLELIRKRATELNLTQADLDSIHAFIQS